MQKSKIWHEKFIIIIIINFLIYFSFQLFPSALPGYLKSMSANDQTIGWLNGLATIATVLIRPKSAKLLDKYGRKGVFLLSLILMALIVFLYRIFPIVSIILFLRFLHGLCWGVASTASNTIASDNIAKDRFAEAMGYFSLSIGVSTAIAPAISLSFKIDYVIYFAVIAIALATIITFFNDFPYEKVEKKSDKKESLYDENAIMPAIIMFFITITYGSLLTFISLYAKEKSISNPGLYFTVIAITMIISRPVIGKIIDKLGFSFLAWPSFVLLAVALILLKYLNTYSVFIFSAILYGLSYGSLQTTFQTLSVLNHKQSIASANATFFTGFDSGIGLGAVVAGFISSKISYANTYGVLSLSVVFAAILYFVYTIKKES